MSILSFYCIVHILHRLIIFSNSNTDLSGKIKAFKDNFSQNFEKGTIHEAKMVIFGTILPKSVRWDAGFVTI